MTGANDTPGGGAAADDARRLAEIEADLSDCDYGPAPMETVGEMVCLPKARYDALVAEAAELRRAAGEGERKPVAEVLSASGRLYLAVNGVAVATEGDECRDAELVAKHRAAGYEPWRAGFGRYFWDDALLVTAAGIINSALAASAGAEERSGT